MSDINIYESKKLEKEDIKLENDVLSHLSFGMSEERVP